MAIQHMIWRVGDQPQPLAPGKLPSEQALEAMIVKDSRILSADWMLIGRQEQTGLGGRIDLLAIEPDGSLVLIELKRERTPRDIIAQALDYASWVERLEPEEIAQIYQRFSGGGDLAEVFRQRFGVELTEDDLNQSHQIVIVAAELDAPTEMGSRPGGARQLQQWSGGAAALGRSWCRTGDCVCLRGWQARGYSTALNRKGEVESTHIDRPPEELHYRSMTSGGALNKHHALF
jgi:hypothetical protein